MFELKNLGLIRPMLNFKNTNYSLKFQLLVFYFFYLKKAKKKLLKKLTKIILQILQLMIENSSGH